MPVFPCSFLDVQCSCYESTELKAQQGPILAAPVHNCLQMPDQQRWVFSPQTACGQSVSRLPRSVLPSPPHPGGLGARGDVSNACFGQIWMCFLRRAAKFLRCKQRMLLFQKKRKKFTVEHLHGF